MQLTLEGVSVEKMRVPCGKKILVSSLNDHLDRCKNCQIILSVHHLDEVELLEAVKWYGRDEAWVLYSGGKDSGVLSHWAHTTAKKAGIKIRGCIAVDTTITTPDWKPFIEQACKDFGWELVMLHPPEGIRRVCPKIRLPSSWGPYPSHALAQMETPTNI